MTRKGDAGEKVSGSGRWKTWTPEAILEVSILRNEFRDLFIVCFLPSSFQVFKFKLVCFTFPYGCLILTKHREPMNLNQEHVCSSEVCVCPVAFVYPLFLIPHVMFLVVLIPDY